MPDNLRAIPPGPKLPQELYEASQVAAFDRLTIEEFGIPGLELMERAGAYGFEVLRKIWPQVTKVTVVCGRGNNAGDGYVLARLAAEAGLFVQILHLAYEHELKGEAAINASRCREMDILAEAFEQLPDHAGIIVDAIFGSGLDRPVEGAWADAINAINRHDAPVLALDMPSGLNAGSGIVMNRAVRADATATFIGLRRGLFTGEAPDYCGVRFFNTLDVPPKVYESQEISAYRIDWDLKNHHLEPRSRSSHKGNYGHVLIVGGSPGYSGAARLAGEAALRSGAGLVSVAAHPTVTGAVTASRPELMCSGIETVDDLEHLLARCNVVGVGPGMGQTAWGRGLLERVLETDLPKILDADALNLLAESPDRRDDWILTPHPGEASRLLQCGIDEIQEDRFAAAGELQKRYGGIIVLKGSGTIVQSGGSQCPAICSDGNPGMASGGMGDILTGIIAALIGQGFDLQTAAELGVSIHAAAADKVASDGGERGLIASDLFPFVRQLVNPSV